MSEAAASLKTKPYEEVEEIWSNILFNWERKPPRQTVGDGSNAYLFTIHHRQGPPDKQADTVLTFYSFELIQHLRNVFPDESEVHSNQPQVLADKVFLNLESFRASREKLLDASDEKKLRELAALDALLEWFDQAYCEIKEEFARLLSTDRISFKLLWLLLPPQTKANTKQCVSGEPLGVMIDSAAYIPTFGESCYDIRATYYCFNGESWQTKECNIVVMKFQGTRPIDSLPIFPLTSAVEQILIQRGLLAVRYAGVKYLEYGGALVRSVGHGYNRRTVKERAEGRCMVDVQSHRRMVPDSDFVIQPQLRMCGMNRVNSQGSTPTKTTVDSNIKEEDIWRLAPTLLGFSFVTKNWGELSVAQLSEIQFDRNAFDHLVLPLDQKDIIRGLVQSSRFNQRTACVKDVISQKGGGLVFCLYGAAGCGKTLTAEAVAEILERPLYNIGSGELGTEPTLVEKNLRDALDIAAVWDAVTLIDEADVYLQERGFQDLARNALVSVFLRLLDYHKGILFLTTNRVQAFDSAFTSRFSIALKYPELDFATRKQIWMTFLGRAGMSIDSSLESRPQSVGARSADVKGEGTGKITEAQLDGLCDRPFDGRMIRNLVQTAQGLAASDSSGERFGYTHLLRVMAVSEAFLADLSSNSVKGKVI